jgi:drug/metabolite transporter (DMT)-like permease
MARDAHSLRHGFWAINACFVLFVVGDVIIKLLGQSFPTNELVFLRSGIIAAVIGALMFFKGHRLRLKRTFSVPMVGRCLFDCVNILAFTTAVVHMGIAELYAILLTSPLLMTVMGALLFREPVGIRRWLAIIVGFCGVLLIVKPSIGALDQWALVGFGAAVAAAAREIITQKIDPKTPSFEVTFLSAIFVGVATLFVGYGETWVTLTSQQSMLVLVQAATYLAAALLLVQACRLAPLSIVASFRYTMLVWGGLAGYLIFDDIPDLASLLGAALIAGSGLYTFHREAVRHRELASKVVAPN